MLVVKFRKNKNRADGLLTVAVEAALEIAAKGCEVDPAAQAESVADEAEARIRKEADHHGLLKVWQDVNGNAGDHRHTQQAQGDGGSQHGKAIFEGKVDQWHGWLVFQNLNFLPSVKTLQMRVDDLLANGQPTDDFN